MGPGDRCLSVETSGACMSNLLFEQVKSSSDSEGFLIGHIKSVVSDAISDQSTNDVCQRTIFEITKIVPCHKSVLWYDRKCCLKVDALKDILRSTSLINEEILGWYKSRRESSLMVSLKERQLTLQLKKHFSSASYIFLLLTSNNALSEDRSICCLHTYDYQFFIHNQNRIFISPPINVTNLGDCPQPEYRMTSNISFPQDIFSNKKQTTVNAPVSAVNSTFDQLYLRSEGLKKLLIESEEKLAHETKKLIDLKNELNLLRDPSSSYRMHHQASNEVRNDYLIDLSMDSPVCPPQPHKALTPGLDKPPTQCLLTSPIPDHLNLERSIIVPNSPIESSI